MFGSENVLLFSGVLVQGFEMHFVNVPLHQIAISFDLITGNVTVGTRPSLPVKGISMLLGNDFTSSTPYAWQSAREIVVKECDDAFDAIEGLYIRWPHIRLPTTGVPGPTYVGGGPEDYIFFN